ncbi:glycoside hydrolase family 43 protein [Sphingomonas sp. CARO-RG-8B-R24-01]|uniref:glycoside hydrolase family 43 protein n=1 Tax=Sphingomonas sp. CARO-RG-8B-R24-01 TaxID=2914831 RepID=UPI001F58A728|nr:glycoside hydrolase family 43 protein [Sphingomonas sp. CARO-RG-8B-R24-01]
MLDLTRRSLMVGAGAVGAGAATARPLARERGLIAEPLNPLVRQRADAQVFRHSDGFYYLTGSVPEYDRLVLRRSRTLEGLATAPERVVWHHLASGPLSGFIWAPELHLIDGRWVMYFAAGPSGGGEDVFRIRTWAAVCDGRDPMTGGWSALGQFQAPWDSFNLDSTSFVHRGTRYFCWAQREPGIDTNSNLYLAPLATPLTLARAPVRLSVPTLEWEIRGFKVNEAPSFLARNGRVFISYSASATDERYCLGLLSAKADADLMTAASWTKSPVPVLTTSEATGVYGPGHNSFTVDERGRDVLVYHGRDYREIKGDPLFDPNRHTRLQRLYYRPDGTPDFGIPVGNGALPDRLSPLDAPGLFLRNDGGAPSIGCGSLAGSQFRQLADPGGSVSLAPIEAPDHRLCAIQDGSVRLVKADARAAPIQGSRFTRIAGLADRRGVSFVAAGTSNVYLHHIGPKLMVGDVASTRRESATFALS